MSWCKEIGTNGLPIWRGCDSVVNLHRERAQAVKGCLIPLLGFMVVVALAMLYAGASGDHGTDQIGIFIGILTLLACVPASFAVYDMVKGGGLSLREFFSEEWALWEVRSPAMHGLAFTRAASASRPAEWWTVRLSDIARVETGPTREWIGARKLGAIVHEVTAFESQTFLFMNDGSRHVICSVNGDREATATLAQSVRAWLEERKAETAKKAATCGGGAREGFAV